jgi:serine/threonine-protein kinase
MRTLSLRDDEGIGVEGIPFGRYTLLAQLGQGGMGEVWRAYDTETTRIVAVKLLTAKLVDDPSFQERFRREARIASSLNEPHVIPIHHFGEIDGRLYVDMRLIEGQDLATMIGDRPLSPPRAVTIIEQIASALNAAHRAGLVHRDVKPSNILVVEDDFAYLIDFGIARAATDSGLTSTGATIGTWAYMAPERFSGGEADPRSDTYALACVLHEALTGAPPYGRRSVEQQIAGHITQPPPRPSTQVPGVPREMDEVIAIGMAKNPGARYSSAREFAAAARAALTSTGAVPPPPVALQPPSPPPAPYQATAPTNYHHPIPPAYGNPRQQIPAHFSAPVNVGPPNAVATKRSPWTVPLVVGAVIALVLAAVATVLIVNGNESTTTAKSSSSGTSTTNDTTSETTSTTEPTTTRTYPPGQNPTIADYIKKSGFTETPIKQGAAGAPEINLPVPAGWEPGGDKTPDYAYGAIFYTGPNPGNPAPRIEAIYSKLTGNVDAQRILDLAPGELRNLSGFTPSGDGQDSTLGGFPAFQMGGSWDSPHGRELIAQKTVVIASGGAVFVLQLNAHGNPGQEDIMAKATDVIDQQTTITA